MNSEIKKTTAIFFEKSISRDWSLLNAELHQISFTRAFRDQLGWCFSDVVYEGTRGSVSVYNPREEYLEGMRDFVLHKLETNKHWLEEQISILARSFDAYVEWSDALGSFSEYSDSSLLVYFDRFVEYNLQIWPRFIMILMFPIQMEGNVKRDFYSHQISASVEARKRFERAGPITEKLCLSFGETISERAGLNSIYARFLSQEDISIYLNLGKAPVGLERRKEYFLVSNEGVSDENISDYFNRKGYVLLETGGDDRSGRISGKVAYPGMVNGRVRVVLNKESFTDFVEGEVLVASMTTPDYLPIMEKAAAFVTDEGGVTCHASIVARELKKPCIIGTKIATKVLKDGDMVEVDADKGVVRVIS